MQTEKDTVSARCRGGLLSLSVVVDEEGHPLENEDESGRRFCEYWGTIFQARVESPRHHQHEDILRNVQKATDDTRWTIDKTEFDLLNWMEFHVVPTSVSGMVDRNSSTMLTEFFWNEVPFLIILLKAELFFIAKTTDIHDNGRISRLSFDIVQLRLQTCFFCHLSWGTSLALHEMHTSFAEMHLLQANDCQHF